MSRRGGGRRDTSGYQLIDTPDYLLDAENRYRGPYNNRTSGESWLATGIGQGGLTLPGEAPTEEEWAMQNALGGGGYPLLAGNYSRYGSQFAPANIDLVQGALGSGDTQYDYPNAPGVYSDQFPEGFTPPVMNRSNMYDYNMDGGVGMDDLAAAIQAQSAMAEQGGVPVNPFEARPYGQPPIGSMMPAPSQYHSYPISGGYASDMPIAPERASRVSPRDAPVGRPGRPTQRGGRGVGGPRRRSGRGGGITDAYGRNLI